MTTLPARRLSTYWISTAEWVRASPEWRDGALDWMAANGFQLGLTDGKIEARDSVQRDFEDEARAHGVPVATMIGANH